MSGTNTPRAIQPLTGDPAIDGMLSGFRWDGPISYGTPDSQADYQAGYSLAGAGVSNGFQGFSPFNAKELAALQSALDTTRFGTSVVGTGFAVEGFTNLQVDFKGAGAGDTTIRAANSVTLTGFIGLGFHPGYLADQYPSLPGDLWLNPIYFNEDKGAAGSKTWRYVLHEAGHTLGLKHPNESPAVPAALDSIEYTVMSYRSYSGGPLRGGALFEDNDPQSYMMLDIQALQTMYGANYDTNSSDTVYSWHPGSGQTFVDGKLAIDPTLNVIFATIWDGGGIDTYDLSSYRTNLDLNLSPGTFSTFDTKQLAQLDTNAAGQVYAAGNIANAMLFDGDPRSLIENAIGGFGNDRIYGNIANNVLTGNDGDDTLYGLEGDDLLLGGAGNDLLSGGLGDDVLDGGPGADVLAGRAGDDVYYVDNPADVVRESADSGFDVIFAATSYTMGTEQVEVLASSFSLSGHELIGNQWGQTINGSSGNDRIAGGGGHDVLWGYSGNDVFAFIVAPSAENVATIADFSTQADKIELSRAVFASLDAGTTLSASAFAQGTAPTNAEQRILYDKATGALFYDGDGNGAGPTIQFASLSAGLALTASHFSIA